MEFVKCVHMARYELILKQDGAIWLRIISGPLLTPQRGYARLKLFRERFKKLGHNSADFKTVFDVLGLIQPLLGPGGVLK